jgi:hypothetical protein
MPPQLGQFLNKTVLVSIPEIFKDGRCRPYTLVGIEFSGVWLQGGDLATRLLLEDHEQNERFVFTAFVPYSQIAAVLVGTALQAPPLGLSPSKVHQELRKQINKETHKVKHSAKQDAEDRKKRK